MNDNIEQLSDYRSPEANAEVESRLQSRHVPDNPQTTLDVYHTPEGNMFAEAKNGSQLRVDYVDVGAIITPHESKIKDEEVATAGRANQLIDQGQEETAKQLSKDQVEKTKQDAEPVDVFSRVFRAIRSLPGCGRESILSVKSNPDWSIADANAGAVQRSIDTNMAFMIPESLKTEVLRIMSTESNRGVGNSEERSVENILTGNARGEKRDTTEDEDNAKRNYIGIPVRSKDTNPLFMFFIFGKTIEDTARETAMQEGNLIDINSRREKKEPAESSTVDRDAA